MRTNLGHLLRGGVVLLASALVGCQIGEEAPASDEPLPDLDARRPKACGDDRCSRGETCSSCPDDCGVCEGDACGDLVCTGDESCSSCAGDCGSCPGHGTFELIGSHPDAAAQPTATGKVIRSMAAFGGKVYFGFGDYGANTGPIPITPFDPAAGAFVRLGNADTEAIYAWKTIGGRLFAPSIDPRGPGDYAVGEPWTVVDGVSAEHAFDMATLTGTDLWIVGSTYSPAASSGAWRSLDGGHTWSQVMTESGNAARYYFVGVLGGKLYVHATDFGGPTHAHSKVFDGTRWSDGPPILTGSTDQGCDAQAFAGRIVFKNGCHFTGKISTFDGHGTTVISASAADYEIVGGQLYLLSGSSLRRTTNYSSWTTVTDAMPTGATAFAILGGTLYVGTQDARVYRYTAAL